MLREGHHVYIDVEGDGIRTGIIVITGAILVSMIKIWIDLIWKVVAWKIIDEYPAIVGRLPTLVTTFSSGKLDKIKTWMANKRNELFPYKHYMAAFFLTLTIPLASFVYGFVLTSVNVDIDICKNGQCLHATGFGNLDVREVNSTSGDVDIHNKMVAMLDSFENIPSNLAVTQIPTRNAQVYRSDVIVLPDKFEVVPSYVINRERFEIDGPETMLFLMPMYYDVFLKNGTFMRYNGSGVTEARSPLVSSLDTVEVAMEMGDVMHDSSMDAMLTIINIGSRNSSFIDVALRDMLSNPVIISSGASSVLSLVSGMDQINAIAFPLIVSLKYGRYRYTTTMACKNLTSHTSDEILFSNEGRRLVTLLGAENITVYRDDSNLTMAEKMLRRIPEGYSKIVEKIMLIKKYEPLSLTVNDIGITGGYDVRQYGIPGAVFSGMADIISKSQPPVYVKKVRSGGLQEPRLRINIPGFLIFFAISLSPIVVMIAMAIADRYSKDAKWRNRFEQSDVWNLLSYYSGSAQLNIHPVHNSERRELACNYRDVRKASDVLEIRIE